MANCQLFYKRDEKDQTVVQEQEKQRSTDKKKEEAEKKSLEKKKEEMGDEVQKLHVKLKQEQQRWDRACVAREKQQVDLKSQTCLRSHSPLLLKSEILKF